MKMLKLLSIFILSLCTILVVTQSRNILPNNVDLIQQTCKKTPNYALCIEYLNADPKAPTADVNGLAQIMVNVMKTKANDGLNKIHQLIAGGPPGQQAALKSCAEEYNTIVVYNVPNAISALQKGDPKFAEEAANDAANEANDCERGFSGNSPLTTENNVMHDASVITSAIVKILL